MLGKLRLMIAMAAIVTVMTGCASTIRSDVIAFHHWPTEVPDKSFTFEANTAQKSDLEYRRYQDLVRNELSRLGYIPDTDNQPVAFTVTLTYRTESRQIVMLEPAYDPFWYGSPFYPGWGRHPPFSPYPHPFYDPFWGPPLRQTAYPVYRYHLQIAIKDRTQTVYQVEVVSDGGSAALATIMPYMIRSAFTDFPGQSGVMHSVQLTVD